MAVPVPVLTFNNGQKVPAVGLGSWMGELGKHDVTEATIKTALKHGYRHFDTAAAYGNEEAVGKAIRESGVPRDEVFVVTKLGWEHSDVQGSFDASLQKLGLDYIDLWLMHWPLAIENGKTPAPKESPTFVETWKKMEKVLEGGKVKSIGVSNFSIKTLEMLLKEAKIVPVTNQVELHPGYPQFELLEYCKSKNIILTAYSPLGQYNSPFFNNETVQKVAKNEGGTVGQVLISWAIQRGTIVIPKSEKEERIKENIQLLTLSAASMTALDFLHVEPGLHRPLCVYFPLDPGNVLGWTYEQLGWKLRWDYEKNGVYAL